MPALKPEVLRPLVRSLEQFRLGDGGGEVDLSAADGAQGLNGGRLERALPCAGEPLPFEERRGERRHGQGTLRGGAQQRDQQQELTGLGARRRPQPRDLRGVVGDQADAPMAGGREDGGGPGPVARLGGQTEGFTITASASADTITTGGGADTVTAGGGADISCRYGEHEVCNGLSLRVEPGEIACLLGPSGCGKTTALYLLLKFLEPDHGTVRVDGIDIRTITIGNGCFFYKIF